MTKIIINGRFLVHRITGVERYAREIINELDKIVEPDQLELAVPPEVEEIPKYYNIGVKKVGRLNNRLWEHISFPCYVRKQKGVSVNLCNVAPLSSPGIVCIHDVKIKAYPHFFSKKFITWYRLLFFNETKRANRIITVSDFSKKELCKFYNVKEDRITVISDAWQHFERIGFDEDTLNKYNLQKKRYFFSMCSLEPNKNFKWIAEVAKKNEDYIFAVAGSINKAVFSEGLGFDCPDNMRLLGYVSDEEAKTLMRDCKAFIFPSIYEGFGIPPLEALSAGTDCLVVSNTEVMHELFEDSVNYIDTNNYDYSLKNIITISDKDRINILSKYSWRKSAIKLKALLSGFN